MIEAISTPKESNTSKVREIQKEASKYCKEIRKIFPDTVLEKTFTQIYKEADCQQEENGDVTELEFALWLKKNINKNSVTFDIEGIKIDLSSISDTELIELYDILSSDTKLNPQLEQKIKPIVKEYNKIMKELGKGRFDAQLKTAVRLAEWTSSLEIEA